MKPLSGREVMQAGKILLDRHMSAGNPARNATSVNMNSTRDRITI
jgi:hypothetical protein